MVVAKVLAMFAAAQLLAHGTLHLGDVFQLGLILPKDVVFLTDYLRSIDVIPMQRLEHALIELGLVDLGEGAKLEVGVLLRDGAKPKPFNVISPLFQMRDRDRTVRYLCHLLNFRLQIMLGLVKQLLLLLCHGGCHQ